MLESLASSPSPASADEDGAEASCEEFDADAAVDALGVFFAALVAFLGLVALPSDDGEDDACAVPT
jgi:hypothetical protein